MNLKLKSIFLSIIFCVIIIWNIQFISAAHWIVGEVFDAFDGEPANDHLVILWNPAVGIQENVTDIVGPNGNSGTNNIYMIDCEELDSGCLVDDELRIRVINEGDDYTSYDTNVIVSGVGFDEASPLRLNSPPNITLNSPVNYVNSTSSVNFTCTGFDLDSNLYNVSLFGNWSGGWHLNETHIVTGNNSSPSFLVNISDGLYEWNCLVNDNLSISSIAEINYTISVDSTKPLILSIYYNLTNPVCGFEKYVRVNCTSNDSLSGVENVLIETKYPNGSIINYSAQELFDDTYYVDILADQYGFWNFSCWAQDYSGNIYNVSHVEPLDVRSNDSDLRLFTEDILFSNYNPLENIFIDINATIYNYGCTEANDFLVGFYDGDPDLGGIQISGNVTMSIEGLNDSVANVTLETDIGETNIFVFADFNYSIIEYNETNNKANKTLFVGAWQEFYGNITLDKILANSVTRNLTMWDNITTFTGNIFITDTESDVSWVSLLPIGKNGTMDNTTNDFSEIDNLLGMTNFIDSVSSRFTSDGTNPLGFQDYFVYQYDLFDIPVINSTNSSNFTTGILWDYSDDVGDGEYSIDDQEDLIFASVINNNGQGAFGNYDYEITIPVRIREYDPTDSNDVYIYFDLN